MKVGNLRRVATTPRTPPADPFRPVDLFYRAGRAAAVGYAVGSALSLQVPIDAGVGVSLSGQDIMSQAVDLLGGPQHHEGVRGMLASLAIETCGGLAGAAIGVLLNTIYNASGNFFLEVRRQYIIPTR